MTLHQISHFMQRGAQCLPSPFHPASNSSAVPQNYAAEKACPALIITTIFSLSLSLSTRQKDITSWLATRECNGAILFLGPSILSRCSRASACATHPGGSLQVICISSRVLRALLGLEGWELPW